MNDECTYRYLFLVRQRWNDIPRVDSFYELKVPANLTGDQLKIMTKLDENFCKEEFPQDTQALNGMLLRLRFNSDMFQNVCLIRSPCPITADDLDIIIKTKHHDKTLDKFLDESKMNIH